jgi:ADP-ribose pyrophosphatase YjhB (NUDIX family)
MEHVFRPHYPWGLPGGWVERGENPANTVRREFEEELGLWVEIKQLLLCEVQGGSFPKNTTPSGLGLVYYCRLTNGTHSLNLTETKKGYEILSLEWVNPALIAHQIAPLEHRGIILAKQVFDQEQSDQARTRVKECFNG